MQGRRRVTAAALAFHGAAASRISPGLQAGERPIHPLAGERPIHPLAGERPIHPLAGERPIHPLAGERRSTRRRRASSQSQAHHGDTGAVMW